MKLNFSRFETLEHVELQYRRLVGDSCVPKSNETLLGTQWCFTYNVRTLFVCLKVSLMSDCKMVKILRMPMNNFIDHSIKNGQAQSEDLQTLDAASRKNFTIESDFIITVCNFLDKYIICII